MSPEAIENFGKKPPVSGRRNIFGAERTPETGERRRGVNVERISDFPTTNVAVALALAEAGISVFPCAPSDPARPESSSGKPLVKWRDESTTDTDTVRAWWGRWPEALPAVDCGKSGLFVLDPDRHGDADGVAALESLRREHGWPAGVMTVETPRNGRHHYFKGDGRGNAGGSLPSGIDVRGAGGYVIAPGAVRPDGRRWTPVGGLRAFVAAHKAGLPALPAWLSERLGTRPDARRKAPCGEPAFASMEELRAAVMAIPNNDEFNSREKWFHFLAGIKHEAELHDDEDGGLEIAHEWSEAWTGGDYDGGRTDAAWRSVKRSDGPVRTGKTIRRLALQNDWRQEGEIVFEDEREGGERRERSSAPLFRSLAERKTDVPRPYLVKRWLYGGQLSVFYGQSTAGKTFAAIDLALHVAMGKSWRGQNVKRGAVAYIALEDPAGVQQRAEAWCKRHGVPTEDAPFFICEESLNFGNGGEALDRLAEAAKATAARSGLPLSLIVVDTLAYALTGDENSAADVNAFITAVARLQRTTGAHILLVHHEGKDPTKGMRGSSALFAAADVVVRVKTGKDDARQLTVEKQKAGRLPESICFVLETVDMGVADEDGDPIESAVVAPLDGIDFDDEREAAEGQSKGDGKMQKDAKAAFETLRGLDEPVTIVSWRQAFRLRGGPNGRMKKDTADRLFNRAKRELEAMGAIAINGEVVSSIENTLRKRRDIV